MPPVTVHQPAPCHESWEAMTPTNLGRHCAACQTQVVDFTRMTDGEVVAFLRQTIPGRRCGMFREDQVGRPMLAAAQPVTGFRRWVVAGILLFGSVYGMKARAQGLGQNPVPGAKAAEPASTRATAPAVPDSLFLVQGVVRNRLGIRTAGVRVNMRGFKGTTDTRGYFRVLISQSEKRTTQYIVLRYYTDDIRLAAIVPFDSARTKLYHIRLRKEVPRMRGPGFY